MPITIDGSGTITGVNASGGISSAQNVARANLPVGTVLQVVSTFDNTQYTFNSGSAGQTTYYSISGLTVNITPTSATSKILIIATCAVGQVGNNYNNFLRLYRNSTPLALGNSSGFNGAATGGFRASDSSALGSIAMNFLDSPATTSATTYSVQICNSGGSVASYINRPAQYSGWEQTGSSTITVMEIAT